ncbi:MDR family oxidoreductase [Rouxiella sp. Mn2063]|uniref:acrylyl-CoA reductase (NADPH) n=1 Tax=Rouxiella sp. Mn2063 TaxID=3395262 RepID=UPI003BD563DB
MFQAILIEKTDDKSQSTLTQLSEDQLPPGEVLIDVHYSSLNYKDGLAITGKGPIVRSFPMVPGIDFAGIVTDSSNADYVKGDKVLVNGWGFGEQAWGGLAQKARVDAKYLTRVPESLSLKDTMIIGTAGYTAMLCIIALEKNGVTPEKGQILVTGANGGVGSFAIALLAKLGYQVAAATGRPHEQDYLITTLGANEIIDRTTLSEPGKPLQKARWAAAIDSVGSYTLANVCASIIESGTVAACGMAQGMDFNASVAPFILRNVTLAGINSVTRPAEERDVAWARLAQLVSRELLDAVSQEIPLENAIDAAECLINGDIRGRVVVNLQE